jgi:hypothetical protein
MNIPLYLLLNIILVSENIRQSILIQPIDYGEFTTDSPITKNILDNITQVFPYLYQSTDYEGFQGVIISYNSYDGQTISSNKMGEILSYPCFSDFSTLDRSISHYDISLNVYINNIKINLFTNLCQNRSKIEIFEILAKTSEKVLKSSELLKDYVVGKVFVTVNKIRLVSDIIDKIILNEDLDKDDIYEIDNIFWNNFMDDNKNRVVKHIQFDNPIHKGVLLTLLEGEINQIMSPFYPIQNHVDYEDVKRIAQKSEKDIIEILIRTSHKKYNRNISLCTTIFGI